MLWEIVSIFYVAMDTAGNRATKADYVEAVAHLTEAVRGQPGYREQEK